MRGAVDSQILLKDLEKILVDQMFDCSIEPSSADHEEPFLLVYLGHDKANHERILQVRSKVESLAGETFIAFISMIVYLPFTLLEKSHYDLINVISMINALIELPGFELDLVEDKVRFRYVLAAGENGINSLTIKTLVGVIGLTLDLFADVFENVNAGKITFQDFVNGIEELPASEIPKK